MCTASREQATAEDDVQWHPKCLGIIRDLRTALQKSPLPLDTLKEVLGEAA
jgi:hypothetical protein